MPLFVAGLSHRNAPVELREQLAVDEDKLRELLRDAAASGAVREVLVLSTCNRVEVYAVSVSFAAVELAKKIFERLDAKAVLLVGAGKMSELAARHLVEHGAFPIYVTNRTGARAQEMARALAGTAVPFDELATALAAVDIVITSTGAPEPVITREAVQRIIHARRGRPLFFIDIAVPRDVEDSVDTLDDVYCYDIDDLKQVVDANIRERGREAYRAEAIVDREVAKFLARL